MTSSLHIREADISFAAGHYRQAVSKYLQAAAERPSSRPRIKERLIFALSHVIDHLNLRRCRGGASQLVKSNQELTSDQLLFSQICEGMCSMFAGDAEAMAMLGVKCLDEGVYTQAEFFLRLALEADSDYLSAKENLRVLFDRMVNRWHFHMLNDVQRNSSYFRAIHCAVQAIPNCSVLDIGSGTGILSMMAKRCGAENVYACEMNEAMVKMSCDVLAANGLASSVTVLHSISTMLSVPKTMPNKVNLVVTEIVDAGLLGEHIIPTLRHAWKELLLPCNKRRTDHLPNQITAAGHVIPCGAVVHAMAIECLEIRRRSRLLFSEIGGIKVHSVVLEGSCKALDSDSTTDFGPSFKTPGLTEEPYTCERLTRIRGGYTQLTAAKPVLQFDFTNPEIPLPESRVSLTAAASGQLDAIAVWFDLHLDSKNSFSTGPSWDISWEQAIFPVRETLHLQAGDTVHLHASCTDTLLHMEVDGVSRGVDSLKTELPQVSGNDCEECLKKSSQEQQVIPTEQNAASAELNGGQEDATAVNKEGDRLFYVERSDLCRVNDVDFIECFRRAVAQVVVAVKNGDLEESDSEDESSDSEMEEDVANCLLLDMSRGLSPLGLIAAKEGADFVQIGRSHERYKCLVDMLAEFNQISDHVSFRYLDLTTSMSHSQVLWDIVVCDVVSPQGELRTGVFEELAYIRSTSFHSSSIIMPGHVTVCAAIISSPALRANSLVLGTVPTLGFDVARFINSYQVTHFTDLDLSSWPHQMLSETHEVMTVNLNSLTKKALKIETRVPVSVRTGGMAVGVAYWFKLHLYGGVTISTYQPDRSTSHWHQSVFLFPEDVSMSVDQVCTLRTLLRDSYLDITMAASSSHTN